MRFRFRNLLIIVLLFGLIMPQSASAAPARHVEPDATVFINEIHYDNVGVDFGEAIEIAGPVGTSLDGWSIVLYNGNDGRVYDTRALSGTIPGAVGGYGVVTVNYPQDGLQNGSPDGIALVSPSRVEMFLSYEGVFTAVDGPANGLTSTDIGVSQTSSTPIDTSLQLIGSGSVYSDFTWIGPSLSTFGVRNPNQSFVPVDAPVIMQCPPLTLFQGSGGSVEVSASDADGQVISINLDSVSPDAPVTLDGFVPSAGTGEAASATLTVASSIAPGSYTVTLSAANGDATPQTATCSLVVTVEEVLTIGEVQGETTDDEDGLLDRSPFAPPSGNSSGQTVLTRGVIYQKTTFISSGQQNYGFFIQNTDDFNDGNPLTSDGIFVFHGRFTTLLVQGGGNYTPQVGDEVLLRGPVNEFFNMTQLNNPRLVQVLRSGVDVDAEVPAVEVNPPANLADANRYWERLEGMRAQVPAGSLVIDGRDVFASSKDAEVWLARADSEIAQREDPYARRAFRDPHPLDDIPEELFDNGNGYRIIVGSQGLKATEGDVNALLAPARTFDTLTNAPDGGVYFSFSKYQIMVQQQLELEEGVDPSLNAPPEMHNTEREYSTATFNLENLYDFRDDPFDGCDFTGNSGCPGVSPPFDYVPASQEDYETRLYQIASQIINDLYSPDILLVQEVEDQDFCTLSGEYSNNGESLTCGASDNADGRPDPLQDLAAAIAHLGGPEYDSAYDRDGADDRGIVSAFLYRTDRAELLPVDAGHPVLGSAPQVQYRAGALPYNSDAQNPKALNALLPGDVDTSTGTDGDNVFTRPPQVGYFRVWRDGIGESVFTDLYAISNHFSSTPDGRVGQRTEQAAYNAAIVDALQAADPEAYVTVGGDLNVFPRPDDPFTPGHPLFPSDQLGPLYDQGMTNLFDVLLAEVPVAAYGYQFQGQAQVLDQLFASPALLEELVEVRAAHINADWPADYFGDGARGTSDHDPQVARYHNLPTLDRLETLVNYYAQSGRITGNNTLKNVLKHLQKAREFQAAGKQAAYDAQLQVFINQVSGLSPQFIDSAAAAALVKETEMLRQID